jgi:hypothetical protein
MCLDLGDSRLSVKLIHFAGLAGNGYMTSIGVSCLSVNLLRLNLYRPTMCLDLRDSRLSMKLIYFAALAGNGCMTSIGVSHLSVNLLCLNR